MTQTDLADACASKDRVVSLLNWQRLTEVAEFDPAYLQPAYPFAPTEGNLFASASVAIARKLAANSPSWVTTTESMRLLPIAANAGPNLRWQLRVL